MGNKEKQYIARIDFEVSGSGINRSTWYNGWKEGDPPANVEYIENTTPIDFFRQFDQQGGWSIRMFSAKGGRLLRGEVTRIDFKQLSDGGWEVSRFPRGWSAGMPPMKREIKPVGFAVEDAIRWCIENGWTVHRFQGGMRAWKGQPQPVRDAATIKRMRAQLERKADESFRAGRNDMNTFCDLAFDRF